MTLRLLLLGLLLMPGAVLAQQAVLSPSRVSSAISGVNAGKTLRVSTVARGRTTGKLVGIDGATLSLEFERAPVLIPLSAIDTLWIRNSGTAPGFIIGGLVSAALFSILICQPSCDESGVVYPGLLFTWIPGAVVGGFVGHRIVRWDRRIP